jgi:ABC-type dipeptide/oligopeptide/nickel transport system permease component
MVHYLTRRLAFVLLVLFGITLITFMLERVVPGDPARLLAGARASQQVVSQVRRSLGLDRPLWDQYASYMAALARGNLGTSIVTRNAVLHDLVQYFPATLEIILYALLLGIFIGIVVGVVSASRGGKTDVAGEMVATTALSVPVFWLAILLQFALYSRLHLLPAGGRLDPGVVPPPTITGLYTVDALLEGNLPLFADALRHVILPATALMIPEVGLVAKTVRASMLEVLGKDYVRSARAKGLTPRRVYFRHALRNALLPAVTVIGLEFGLLVSGTVLVETIFSWPGLGSYTDQAIASSDYDAIMGVTIVVAVAYVLVNLVVDIAYAWLDPRVRLT